MATKVKRQQQTLTADSGPQVFPYGRFSFKGQEKGGSKRRQTGEDGEETRAKRYADKVGLPLNQSLKMFDEGISARHGENITRGALGKFLSQIEAGLIPKGSILWVESVDRLTRQNPLKGLKFILFGIIEKSIGIYVDDLHTLYNEDNADDSIGELYGEIRRAFKDSQRKSELIGAACEQKLKDAREKGTPTSAHVPAWIKLGPKGERLLRKGADKPLIKALKMREQNDGTGAATIAQVLNASNLWKPPNGWNEGYVGKLLRDRRLLGEHQPMKWPHGNDGPGEPNGPVIPDYYPNVLKRHPGLFENVQRLLGERNQATGPQKAHRNILRKLTRCGYCGGPMYHKPQSQSGGGKEYLFCYDSQSGKSACECGLMPYDEVVQAILDKCQRIRPNEIIPQADAQVKACQALRFELQRANADVVKFETKLENANELAEDADTKERRRDWEQRAIAHKAELKAAKKVAAAIDRDLKQAERSQRDLIDWQDAIASLRKVLETPEGRKKMNAHLRTFIEKVEVFARGYPDPTEKCYNAATDDFEDWMDAAEGEGLRGYWLATHDKDSPVTSKQARAMAEPLKHIIQHTQKERGKFTAWVIGQRRTKAGRFLRIHFNHTNARREWMKEMWGSDYKAYVDIVPEGSIAGDTNIVSLWEQFKTTRKPR